MSDANFIGLGHNPNLNVPDIPEGFGAALSKEPKAHHFFDSLSIVQKASVIQYIQSNNATGDDAKNKIIDVVTSLKNNSLNFML